MAVCVVGYVVGFVEGVLVGYVGLESRCIRVLLEEL